MSEVRRGCLVLADISGYTRYLSGVELEHSHDVLADLLGVVAAELGAVGALAKLEGDAVFVCDHEGTTTGEKLVTGLDASYAAFMRRRRTISLRTTCTCEACARIPSLDLKFAAHHGEFVEHVVAEALALAPHVEHYPDIGAVPGWVANVGERWRASQERNPVVVSEADALVTAARSYDVPRGALWDALAC